MEKEVYKQFSVYLEENKFISDFQFGFRRNKSTELAAITMVEERRRSVGSGCIGGACFLDLSKAFDTISHVKLVSKLTNYGVNEIELEWFRDYPFNRKVQVMHDKCFAESKPLFSGVPQESILGPLLFIIFFNVIILKLYQPKIIQCADNTVIFFADKDYDKLERALCSDMKRLSEWFTTGNELLLNLKPGKTELLV